jgi:hypothetical protein
MTIFGNGYYNEHGGKTLIRYAEDGEYFFIIESCRFKNKKVPQEIEALDELKKRFLQMIERNRNTPNPDVLEESKDGELSKELSLVANSLIK